jgi:predicted Zn-dependent protease
VKILFALVVLPLAAQQNPDPHTVAKHRAMGQMYVEEIRRHGRPLNQAAVTAYTEKIGAALAAQLSPSPFRYSFEVIAGLEATEPMPLPGGHILIPARFFSAVNDEGEFAAMVAHSIGHIALHHGIRPAARAGIPNVANIPLVFMGGWTGRHADAKRPVALIPASLLERQRSYEVEADRFGIGLASRAGFPAQAFRRYIERTQLRRTAMSPLPDLELRLAKIDETAASLPAGTYSGSDEFAAIQEAVREATTPPKLRRPPSLRNPTPRPFRPDP